MQLLHPRSYIPQALLEQIWSGLCSEVLTSGDSHYTNLPRLKICESYRTDKYIPHLVHVRVLLTTYSCQQTLVPKLNKGGYSESYDTVHHLEETVNITTEQTQVSS